MKSKLEAYEIVPVDAKGMATGLQEKQWIEQAQAGDLAAFNQLVLAHQDSAFRLARWMLNDSDGAEDIVQNVFLCAYQKLARFRCASFRSWLLRIVHNACIDELRRRKRHPWLTLEAHDGEGEEIETPRWLVDSTPQPEEALMQREEGQRIEACLQRLPAAMRAVIVLIDIEGLDYSEAAAALGLPLGTVKSRVGRARAQLREGLKEPTPLAPFPRREGGRINTIGWLTTLSPANL